MITARIKSIRPIENEPLSLITLVLCDGEEQKTERLTVFADFCAENGIGIGAADENTVETLRDAAALCAAVRRGESILSFAASSKKALTAKLVRKGISPEYARRAADMLSERGFVDDRENALIEAERCVRKLWGPRRILQHLTQKGYSDAVLYEVREFLSDTDFSESAELLMEKRYPGALSKDRREKERAVAALMRYGYSISDVRAAVSRLARKRAKSEE